MLIKSANSKLWGRCVRAYLWLNRRVWTCLPAPWRAHSLGLRYGRHLHALVCAHSERRQNHSTWFLRNRPELELISRLLRGRVPGSSLDVCVLACSKGAEVYSIVWAIRKARSDLDLKVRAVDISTEVVEFAKRGVYSRDGAEGARRGDPEDITDILKGTWKDQPVSIFERMTEQEKGAMFEIEGDRAKVQAWLKEGITWSAGDAGDPGLVRLLGPHDIVVANRFLCHMSPAKAENYLPRIGDLVRPGGYLFVSGIDLDVRTKVARTLGWTPVMELIREVHEGDYSLSMGWPLDWWGLEPFREDLPDWKLRYAAAFQIGKPA